MPIGFPAYAEDAVRYRGVSRKKLRCTAEDALDELGWSFQYLDKWTLRASVPSEMIFILVTWGARFMIEIEDEELFLRSEGAIAIAWIDLGQHTHNIRKFLDCFDDLLESEE